MTFIVATNVIASRPPERRPTGTPHARAKNRLKYHGTAAGQTGPLVQRLEGYGKLWGLAIGPWGKGSKDLHSLVSVLGNSMVQTRSRERGWEGGEGELGQVMGQL